MEQHRDTLGCKWVPMLGLGLVLGVTSSPSGPRLRVQ